jgi:hypothetical protein
MSVPASLAEQTPPGLFNTSVLLAKHLFRSLLPKASLVSKEVHQPELCFNIKSSR